MAAQIDRSSPEAAARQESIVEVLWRRKQLVIIVFLLSLVSAAVWLKVTPKRIPVETRIQVTRKLPANSDPNTVDLPTFLNTQAELIRSATILSSAMGAPNMDQLQLLAGTDNPINLLEDRLEVQAIPQSQVISVRLNSTNTDEASQIVSAVVQAYVSYIESQHTRNTATDTYTKITDQRTALDKDRTDFKRLLATLQAETSAYTTPGDSGVSLAIQKLRDLSTAHTAAQLELVKDKQEFEDALKAVGMTPEQIDQDKLNSASAVSADGLSILRQNLASMSQQLIEAKRQYVPSHPAVRSVQRQIKDMQLSLAAAMQSVVSSAASREKDTQELLAEQEKITQNLNAKVAEQEVLSGKVKDLDGQIALLDSKLKDLSMTETVGIDASQFEDVRPLYNEATPNSNKTLGLAALIGLAAGMLVAMVREWISPSLGAVHRIADTVGVPLLGTLPRVTGHTPAELAKLTLDVTDGDAAEAFRSVRTSLLFGADHCQTIAITSPATGDGKTTLAANLAILLAQSGKRVALVDADFRQPAVHELFSVDNRVGLTGVMGGEDLDSAVRRSPVEHLDLLTAGPQSNDVSQQLNSPRFNEVLRQLKGRYDHVLFDTSGVIGSNDARVIAAGCDTTLLVMRDERTTRFAATTARDALLSVGAMLMGIVLNDASRTGPAYPNSGGAGRDKFNLASAPGSGTRVRSRR